MDLDDYDRLGFVRLPGFADQPAVDAMLARVVDIVHDRSGGKQGPEVVLPEANLTGVDGPPEQRVSKVFRLHRDSVFADFATSPAVVTAVAALIGPSFDCFLSQFIFKNPGAWGQPWHQDSYYFRFAPARPIIGVWLAVTAATLQNGCLHVLPGSHREPIHPHIADRRPGANYGYMEIVDHDMSAAVPVLMDPGDLLLFDSHLMHRSTDNTSDGLRGAMVYHYATAGTVEIEHSPVTDFMRVR